MNEKIQYKTWIIRFFSIVLLFATTAIVNANVNPKEESSSHIVASQVFQDEADTNGKAIPISDPLISERSVLLELNSLKKLIGNGFERGHLNYKNQTVDKITKIFSDFMHFFKSEKYIVYCCLKLSCINNNSTF